MSVNTRCAQGTSMAKQEQFIADSEQRPLGVGRYLIRISEPALFQYSEKTSGLRCICPTFSRPLNTPLMHTILNFIRKLKQDRLVATHWALNTLCLFKLEPVAAPAALCFARMQPHPVDIGLLFLTYAPDDSLVEDGFHSDRLFFGASCHPLDLELKGIRVASF